MMGAIVKKKRRCWASVLGGCDGISGEHVVSEAALIGSERWAASDIRGRPPGSYHTKTFTANILCIRHNRDLSPLDAEIGKLSHAGNSASGLVELNGRLVERWLLKTVTNYVASGWGSEVKFEPGEHVVRACFGL